MAPVRVIRPRARRPRSQARRQPACGRCTHGHRSCARSLYPAPGGHQHLGRAVQGYHGIRSGGERLLFRAGSRQDLSPPDVLRHSRRGQDAVSDLFRYVLRLGDLSLVLGQRLGEWVGHAPALEEDLGLANVALDLVGQARLLLSYAGEVEGLGRDEDDIAFLREQGPYLNPVLVEQPNGDFGRTIVRQFLLSAYQLELYEELQSSSDARLAEIDAKAL